MANLPLLAFRRCRVSAIAAPMPAGSARTLFGFNFFGTKRAEVVPDDAAEGSKTVAQAGNSTNTRTMQGSTSNAKATPTSSTVLEAASATSDPPNKAPNSPKDPLPNAGMLPRDAEALQKLLDRDGGSAGFEFEDGAPAGGQRKAVKREMFRLM